MGKAEETGGLGAATEFELNIVLVDDEAFDRRNLSRLAGKLGPSINVQACADEAEFRKTLDRDVFDICFVDNNMGAWNGVQTERLHALTGAHRLARVAAGRAKRTHPPVRRGEITTCPPGNVTIAT